MLLKDVELPTEAKGVTIALGSRAGASSKQQQSGALERYDLNTLNTYINTCTLIYISAKYKILSFFHSRYSTIRVSSNEVRFPSPV